MDCGEDLFKVTLNVVNLDNDLESPFEKKTACLNTGVKGTSVMYSTIMFKSAGI